MKTDQEIRPSAVTYNFFFLCNPPSAPFYCSSNTMVASMKNREAQEAKLAEQSKNLHMLSPLFMDL